MTELDPAPRTPIDDGDPAFGTYRGACETTALEAGDRGIGLFTRLVREKQWQWFTAADDELAVGGAIVDAGPFGNAFCWAVDRDREELLVDASSMLPGPAYAHSDDPTSGDVAAIQFGSEPLTMYRQDDAVRVHGSVGGLTVDVDLEAPPADGITAICPIEDAHPKAMNVTQKELAGRAEGTVVVDGDRRSIDDGVGLLDYTHGILGRETRWKWGFCVGREDDGTPFGFNLVSHHNAGLENAIWLDGERRAVGDATVEKPGEGEAGPNEWRVSTDDDVVAATLEVEAVREENTDVGIMASEYRQPLGEWSGRIGDREFEGCYGVAEDHRAKW